MPLRTGTKRRLLLAKLETTYGVDPTPTAAANSILVSGLDVKPINMKLEDRQLVRSYYGGYEKIFAGTFVTVNFDVEVAGAGSAGSVPGYGPLLEACAMSQTINAAVSVVYAPISTLEKSITLYYYKDGKLKKTTGARGTWSVKFDKQKIPMYSFKFTGLEVAVSDSALLTGTFTAYQKPLACTNANTTPFTLHSYAGVMSSLSIDYGGKVNWENMVGAERIDFLDRTVSGSVDLEDVLVASKNWESIALAGTTGALAITHGTVAGNKVTINAPTVQITDHSESGEDIAMVSMGLALNPNAGNDEVTITVL